MKNLACKNIWANHATTPIQPLIRFAKQHMTKRSANRKSLWFFLLITLAGCGSDKSANEPNPNIELTPNGISTAAELQQTQQGSKDNRNAASIKNKSDTTLGSPLFTRDSLIVKAEQAMESGNSDEAERLLKLALVTNPNDAEIIFRLATTIALSGQLAAAIDYMEAIPADHPDAGLPALGQTADWCFQLKRYSEAESKYRQILTVVPDAAEALRKLAYLYNRQGRRQEAADLIRRLCTLGNVLQDELHALIQISDAMFDPIDPDDHKPVNSLLPESSPSIDTGLISGDDRPYWPIGPLATARIDFSNQSYLQAAQKLKAAIAEGNTEDATLAFLGRVSAEAQDEEGIAIWLNNQTQSLERYADHWAALGLVLLQENRIRQSGRAFLEALSRDPTDFRSISRLRSILESTEYSDQSTKIEQRFQILKAITEENNRIVDSVSSDAEAMLRLANQLETIDRRAEAAIWRLLAGFRKKLPQTEMLKLQTNLQQTLKSGETFPSLASRLCGLELDYFPLPDISHLQTTLRSEAPTEPSQNVTQHPTPAFEDVALSVGLKHAYQVGSQPQESGFSVYQSVGGAVVVLDYDCDGNEDLYFAQGGADPPGFIAAVGNQLYRTADHRMDDVSVATETDVLQYSLGATSGDWNQDGLPDLIVSNIGRNLLMINNGDGTFSKRPIDNRDDKTLMSTSLAIADLNGDHLPDLFEVNYLHDKNLAKRPRKNNAGDVVETLMPKDFQPAFDRIVTQEVDGLLDFHELNEKPKNAKSGLGLVISDFDHQPGNEVFVGNDVGANQWWQQVKDTQQWRDSAMLRGCAFGFSGAKTASMGIATADFDGNGWLDFHITNFQGESVSHYLNEDGFYRDLNLQYSLANPTQDVLGFGAQAIDYDLDGNPDLAVVNGHIENSVATRHQYKQPAQLFVNQGYQFKLTEVEDPSGYWTSLHVGRGLARLDWNRDGKPDLVVTHQAEPSALLINRTRTDNHWLQVRLVGTKSERDAVGARIELVLENQKLTRAVTAGDGFFGHNQDTLFVGLGGQTEIQKMVIHWPSGKIQTFQSPSVGDKQIMAIENQDRVFIW